MHLLFVGVAEQQVQHYGNYKVVPNATIVNTETWSV